MTRTIRSARLIGRTDELKLFDRALGRAAEGTVSILLVGGDAGIGKTRMLDEWGRRAADAGIRMLTGNCLELGRVLAPVRIGDRRVATLRRRHAGCGP